MGWLIAFSVIGAIAAFLIFSYYHKSGQFEDLEDVKFQMFREKDKQAIGSKMDEEGS